MTTMPIDNPLVDFSRADFSSFEVPHPIKAAATDSIIQESRARTPQSAINQRKQERLTVSELNDMDMDEIVKRAYMVPVDTRGPVTRFLDLIDLPRNALFNIAAGDTARRKLAMGDTAALGLARVNTSDVLESLGVRPGIATGILGLVGDVALDPLTYLGPAGMGIKLTAAGGETVSMVGKAGKVFKNTIKEVEAGANISDDLARRYLESAGFTADRIASATDKKALAAEVADALGQGKQTRTNKVLSWIAGEDVERAAVEGKQTIADDIHTYIAPELDDVQKARITAAQDFYKEYGRPFSPGVRIVKDPASAIGFSFTTSKDVPKGSGIFHLPGTAYEISVPAFTPEAIKNTRLAGLVKDAVISGEYFSSPEMKAVVDGHSAIDDLYRQAQETVTASKPSKITEPVVEAAKPFGVGDEVQWTSQGAAQFETPRKITGISDDGKFAFVEGTSTGIPTEQLTRTGEAAKPSAVPPPTPVVDVATKPTTISKEPKITGVAVMPGSTGKDRPIISVNINGVPVMFYRSSEGTSGKAINQWHAVLGIGENDWIIKAADIDKTTGKMPTGINEIDSVSEWLNNKFSESLSTDEVISQLKETARNTGSLGVVNGEEIIQGSKQLNKKIYGKIRFKGISPKNGAKERRAEIFEQIIKNRKPEEISPVAAAPEAAAPVATSIAPVTAPATTTTVAPATAKTAEFPQLEALVAAAIDGKKPMTELEVRQQALADFKVAAEQKLNEIGEAIKKIEADPNAKYADLLYARDKYKVAAEQALSIDKDFSKAKAELEAGKKFSAGTDLEVSKKVNETLREMRAERNERNVKVKQNIEGIKTEEEKIKAEMTEANKQATADNPAVPLDPGVDIIGRLQSGIHKKDVFKTTEFAGHPDPAFNLARTGTEGDKRQAWRKYRTSPHGSEESNRALAEIMYEEVPVYDEEMLANIKQPGEFATQEELDAYENAVKQSITGYELQEKNPGETLRDLAVTDTQAFTHLQHTLLYNNQVSGKVQRIELSKLKVGDEFSFGKADKVHRSPLTVEVTHIDDEGRVYVKAKMPERRPSALERFKKMTKEMLQKELRESKIVEDRYYILDPNSTEIYATKGIESPTVRRKVQLEGEQVFTGNLDELNKDQKFNSRVNKLGLSVKRQKTLEERLNETSKVRKIDEKTYDRGINIVNQNVNEAISLIAQQIYRTTKEEVPGVTLDRIHDEVANIVFKHPDLENIRGEDITRGVQAALLDEPVPAKFKYEPFSFNPKDSTAVREEAMKRLRLGEEDLVRSKLGEGTKYEGLGVDGIRSELVADQLQETLRGMRFQMHPTVKTAYEAEMGAMETDRAARVAKSQQVNEEIAKRINDETKQIQRSSRKAAKDRMDQADVEWRERQRRWMTGEDFTMGGAGNITPTTNIEEIKNGIYGKANEDIKVIEQQTQTALANVENDVRQKAAAEFGAAEFDTSLGKGTEYEGMGERQIRDAVLEKHANDFDAKVKAGEITGAETEKTMPKYLTQEEMVDKEMQISYLHAKANIAARIANASTKPLLAAAGSEVQAAYQSAIQAMGLGADDLGSGILASMMTMTEPFANKNNYGKSAYELARNLERTFVNRMGLAPGRANEMVKQFVRAQDVMQTQAFKAAAADMLRTLEKSGIDRSNWDKASSLAMALIFVGDKTIDEMKQTLAVRRDQAYVDVLEAISGGLLDKTINPKGAEAIQAIADKYRGILQNLDEGSGIPNYVPNVLTTQAQNFINFQHENQASLAKSAASSGGGVVPAEKFSERFQKPRSTIEHAWVDPVTNETRRMLESEMAYMEFSQPYIESLRANNPELAQYIENRQGNVKSWLSLDESQRQAADTYYLSPHEINQRIKDSHEAAGGQGKEMFDNLTNRALNGNDFMYADVLHAIPVRLGSQERKYARDMLQKYLASYELQVEQAVLNTSGVAAGGSKEIITTNGTKVRLVNEGGKQVIYVGNIKYRRPEVVISPEHSVNSALFMVGDRPVNAAYYPEQIADIIDDTAGFFGKPKPGSRGAKVFGDASYEDVMGRMAKGADKLTGYWKVFTLLHPSWTINDIIGNLFLMANMGISPETAVRNAKDALKLVLASSRNDLEEMNRLRIKNKSGVEHIAGPLGQVVESGGAPEVSRQLRTTGEYVDPYAYSMISSMKKLATGDVAGARAEFMGAINESMSASKAAVKDSAATNPNLMPNAQQAMVGADFAFNQMLVRRVWQPWAHLNGLANNWLKATAYFSLLDKGYDAASAARLVSEKMLDMSVLTSTDRNARRLFPFYNWMKNSGVLGVREFFRNPKFFSVAPKVKQALEESFNGEQNLPENARPSWIRDQLALQIGTDPDTRRALTLTSSLPTEAATYAISFATSPFLGWGALQDSLAYVTNSLTPVIKTPLELGARKEFFTKRVISSEGGDITPSEYLIQQARPLRELGIGSLRGGPLLRAFSDSPVMGASRALIGGRLQPFDEERRVQNLQREYDERVDALRRRIGIAERENQKNESIARRIELLRMFNQMEGLGLNVPKWASKQVGQIKEAQSNE